MQATVIDTQIEQELEPQIRLWSIADYHQMIEAGIRTYAKRKNDAKMKKDLSKSNGKKVYYPRLLPVSDK